MTHYCTCPTCGHRHQISDLDALSIESERQALIARMACDIQYREGCNAQEAHVRAMADLERAAL